MRRAYVLMEVMIGGALVALLLATLLAQIADARTRNIVAARDVTAAQLVQQKLEQQSALGFANAGTSCATENPVPGQQARYTRTCTVSGASTQTINGITLSFKDVAVSVTYTPPTGPARNASAVSRVYE